MPAEYLTSGEFERWSESDRDFKERVLDHIEQQAKVNSKFTTDIALLGVEAVKAKSSNSKISAAISALTAGAVAGLMSAFK